MNITTCYGITDSAFSSIDYEYEIRCIDEHLEKKEGISRWWYKVENKTREKPCEFATFKNNEQNGIDVLFQDW